MCIQRFKSLLLIISVCGYLVVAASFLEDKDLIKISLNSVEALPLIKVREGVLSQMNLKAELISSPIGHSSRSRLEYTSGMVC